MINTWLCWCCLDIDVLIASFAWKETHDFFRSGESTVYQTNQSNNRSNELLEHGRQERILWDYSLSCSGLLTNNSVASTLYSFQLFLFFQPWSACVKIISYQCNASQLGWPSEKEVFKSFVKDPSPPSLIFVIILFYWNLVNFGMLCIVCNSVPFFFSWIQWLLIQCSLVLRMIMFYLIC